MDFDEACVELSCEDIAVDVELNHAAPSPMLAHFHCVLAVLYFEKKASFDLLFELSYEKNAAAAAVVVQKLDFELGSWSFGGDETAVELNSWGIAAEEGYWYFGLKN